MKQQKVVLDTFYGEMRFFKPLQKDVEFINARVSFLREDGTEDDCWVTYWSNEKPRTLMGWRKLIQYGNVLPFTGRDSEGKRTFWKE